MKDRFHNKIRIGDIVMLLSSKGVDGYGKVCDVQRFNITVFEGVTRWTGTPNWSTSKKLSEDLVVVLENTQIDYVVNNTYPFFNYDGKGINGYHAYEKDFQVYLTSPKKPPDDF